MKKIYLIRHAKAQQDGYESDFERKIVKKGKKQVKKMLERLENHAFKPQLIIASPAKRTAKTAKLFAKGLKLDKKALRFEDTIYTSGEIVLFEFIKSLDDEFNEIAIIGHNPTMRDLCEMLSKIYLDSFPTCSVFGLEFSAKKFAELKEHSGKLLFFEHLKEK